MPFYDYQCEKCNSVFERKQRYDEEPAAICQCGGKARRVLHSIPIIFKGSGFYVTDHKGSAGLAGDTTSSKDTPKEAVTAEAKSSTAAEAKPATTAEAKTEPRPN
ncbi:MAG: zinc ribbon domain-containing protein [Chloroflexi bacterium]|nr:zinc ribbon domain-containing protein [Chloroflexota bacterium]